MKNKKQVSYQPSEEDMVNLYECTKNAKVAFSIEKSLDGFYVVKYNLDDDLEAIKSTISYKRIDTKKKDTIMNRIIYSNQVDAEKEIFNLYSQTVDYYGLIK
jgi:hypothetical protein